METLSTPESESESESSIAPAYGIEAFEYDLPGHLIAQEPLSERESSRLMSLDRRSGQLTHHVFAEILELLHSGDVLVLNDTKVIPARLSARRLSGGKVEILLVKPDTSRSGRWQAMASPLRKLSEGEWLSIDSLERNFKIQIVGFCQAEDGQRRLIVDLGQGKGAFELLAAVGRAPLPPYIHRDSPGNADNSGQGESRVARQDNDDLARYQTVFACNPGAVAAPTAGLHFSPSLLAQLEAKGVELCFLTLHVGPGTFKPVTTSVAEHTVEPEMLMIPEATCAAVNRAKAEGRRIIAVGTTSCRALETAGAGGKLETIEQANTSLYIKPGHQFKIVDGLITNFHLSRSSLLILVSAFAGKDAVMAAYKVAVAQQYRFYSFGDAMFIQ